MADARTRGWRRGRGRQQSTIEWTEATWNPVTGCDRVSAGCDNCYALTLAKRLKAMGAAKYQNDGDPRTSGPGFRRDRPSEGAAMQPYRGARPGGVRELDERPVPRRVPLGFIRDVFDVMADTPQHTYQVLTKRAHRLARIADKLDWPDNVWMGVSVETRDVRRPDRPPPRGPAAVRFLSCEPLLGPLDDIDLDRHRLGHRRRRVRPARTGRWTSPGSTTSATPASTPASVLLQAVGRPHPEGRGRELDGQL